MREVTATGIAEMVSSLYQQANFELPSDVVTAFRNALEVEESPLGREVLEALIENAAISARERVPLCQDTGLAVVFTEVGQEAIITGGDLRTAVDEGVAMAVQDGYLRASVVASPCFDRTNTGDNTPAVLHTEIVPGDEVVISVLPKGAGSENTSRVAMLQPGAGPDGIIEFAVETVALAGASACPPLFLGIGIGGSMDMAAVNSKKALLRPAATPSPDPRLGEIEREVLERVNALGIGPAGFGGTVTCLGVALEERPCHIASLPVAVNIQCNSARRARGVL